ncbi:3-phenylpropionate/cinnamic acid dioxygenase subunit beta [Amycolatopsis acidiphila]|uniref:3-phenylpropionate/cinnamic acid dioxygenase subunit beta n=1 Tax=Amycolatopsis acidiphila TaxID=715473 RepID=A0A558A816_9PSEU|nr:3-phenylpropionate/cinnamic acid dioxygenase subunit beta [Amycolatopsis acidiphila]TVT20396.1 3-phenylpropionate/cinnamic acid dioxygenase subunit beta [Amycolatopsis acidiphila]UIJ59193.1 3-phenylpropionate/cinnamic acid dioxygenase subunit beta [Amycolatopsis acidiphila]GHG79052.1 3-phenylpropionate dioxygenase [Amycolatopsis acidiphila]
MTVPTQSAQPTGMRRAELLSDISEFLYYEADLLDERRYEEWLDLLADDYHYSVPLRMNVMYNDVAAREETKHGSEVCWFDEPKTTVENRVQQLLTGVHWAEEPVSRVSHIVTNLRIVEVSGDEVEVSARFFVYRNRVADETDFFVGRRRDWLRRTERGWKVFRRVLHLDQSVLMAKNLSVFL